VEGFDDQTADDLRKKYVFATRPQRFNVARQRIQNPCDWGPIA
jgi:hypothetical protein